MVECSGRSGVFSLRVTLQSTSCSSLLLLGLLVLAQGQSPPSEVLLPLIAVDRHGQSITDLKPESLLVVDEKTQVRSGVKLIHGSSLPLRLGVLIDTSDSQRNNDLYNASVGAVKDFVNKTMRGEDDRVFFELFSTTAEATPLLSKYQLSGVSFPLQVGGATVLYDAMALACTDRLGKPDWRTPTRRVIVLMSDGDDSQSHITRAKAEAFPVSSGVVVFTISTNNTGRDAKGDAVLERFAKVTGGAAFSGLRQRDIPKVFDQIRQQIESMYYLTYTAPAVLREGEVHKVEVQPVKGFKAEFRTPRYYAWNP
jgi:VWFA-related protein